MNTHKLFLSLSCILLLSLFNFVKANENENENGNVISGVLMLEINEFKSLIDGKKNVFIHVHNNENVALSLFELAHAFEEDKDLVIANLKIDHIQFGSWKQENRLYNVEDFPSFLLFKKRTSDGECLLPEHMSPHRIPAVYKGVDFSTDSLLNFVNSNSGKFRKIDGKLSEEGEKKNAILKNLYRSEEATCDKIPMPTREVFFNEYVAKNKPVIITGALKKWKALTRWTNSYLKTKLGDKDVNVKLTPDGQFEGCEDLNLWQGHDEPVPDYVHSRLQSPDKAVVRPANYRTDFNKFMDMLFDTRMNTSFYLEYCSIKSDLPELLEDIQSFPFADFLHESLTNIWLGNGKTVGKLHFDEYDNLLCQVSGKKTLTLFDPQNNENLYEGYIREAVLSYDAHQDTFHRTTLTESTSLVMSPVDLSNPDLQRYPKFKNAKSMTCTIEAGEVLFLPSFWWHEVKSSPDALRRNIAVNYWYLPFFDKSFPCEDCRLHVNPFYKDLWRNVTL